LISYVDILLFFLIVFFFQAEDGIRDATVTGVQTCALPISHRKQHEPNDDYPHQQSHSLPPGAKIQITHRKIGGLTFVVPELRCRSEERRVGKESRARRARKY